MQECNLAIEMYEGKAKERSYGVRDEYRLSGFAAMNVLNNLEAVVRLSGCLNCSATHKTDLAGIVDGTLLEVPAYTLDLFSNLVQLLGKAIQGTTERADQLSTH